MLGWRMLGLRMLGLRMLESAVSRNHREVKQAVHMDVSRF
jgi:hypothetical protein